MNTSTPIFKIVVLGEGRETLIFRPCRQNVDDPEVHEELVQRGSVIIHQCMLSREDHSGDRPKLQSKVSNLGIK